MKKGKLDSQGRLHIERKGMMKRHTMNRKQYVFGSHRERIICPQCKAVCDAVVEHSWPFDTYIHHCQCGYTIMESEWQRAYEKQTSKKVRCRVYRGWIVPNELPIKKKPYITAIHFFARKWDDELDRRCRITVEWEE